MCMSIYIYYNILPIAYWTACCWAACCRAAACCAAACAEEKVTAQHSPNKRKAHRGIGSQYDM